jgi:hypothetical protein
MASGHNHLLKENQMTEPTTEQIIENGADVVDAKVFGDLWAYLMDNHTESDAELLKAYLAMRAACAVLEQELGLERMEVTMGELAQ